MVKKSYVLAGVGALLLLSGIVWDCIIWFQNLDVLLTYRDRIVLYWQPTVMEIVGLICVEIAKQID